MVPALCLFLTVRKNKKVKYPKVAVVLVHWNRKNLLEKFLPAVVASDYPNMEVVLADNASDDGSVAFVQRHFPEVKIIVNEQNYGYAGGYNQALMQVKADYYVLLNNDIEVPRGWIEPVIEAMESDSSIGACQPKMLDYHDKALFEYAGACGGFIDKYGFPFCRGRLFDTLEHDYGQYDNPVSVFWATGACLFIRANLFHEVGGFDENFFAHMEEIDLCWRLHLRGYTLKVIPQSKVYHVGGGTLSKLNPQKTYLNFRNSLLMLYKNLEGRNLWWIIFVRATLDLIASIRFLTEGKFGHSAAIHRAHSDFFFKLGKWHKARKKTQLIANHGNVSGMVSYSIVWKYFVRGRRTYTQVTDR